MKDILKDIISHSHTLGIDLVKVNGSTTDTVVSAVAEDRSVIMSGKFTAPVAEFIGTFGMPNLSKLKTILSFSDEYDENAKITVNKNSTDDTPTEIHFENASGDFTNDFRLMSKILVEEKVKSVTFRGATWNVDFTPAVASIMRFKKQASVHSDVDTFSTKWESGNLYVMFGDAATHSGKFVFDTPSGSLSKKLMWPVKQFMNIVDLVGDKHIYISDQGVMRITVNTGMAEYEYLLPARS